MRLLLEEERTTTQSLRQALSDLRSAHSAALGALSSAGVPVPVYAEVPAGVDDVMCQQGLLQGDSAEIAGATSASSRSGSHRKRARTLVDSAEVGASPRVVSSGPEVGTGGDIEVVHEHCDSEVGNDGELQLQQQGALTGMPTGSPASARSSAASHRDGAATTIDGLELEDPAAVTSSSAARSSSPMGEYTALKSASSSPWPQHAAALSASAASEDCSGGMSPAPASARRSVATVSSRPNGSVTITLPPALASGLPSPATIDIAMLRRMVQAAAGMGLALPPAVAAGALGAAAAGGVARPKRGGAFGTRSKAATGHAEAAARLSSIAAPLGRTRGGTQRATTAFPAESNDDVDDAAASAAAPLRAAVSSSISNLIAGLDEERPVGSSAATSSMFATSATGSSSQPHLTLPPDLFTELFISTDLNASLRLGDPEQPTGRELPQPSLDATAGRPGALMRMTSMQSEAGAMPGFGIAGLDWDMGGAGCLPVTSPLDSPAIQESMLMVGAGPVTDVLMGATDAFALGPATFRMPRLGGGAADASERARPASQPSRLPSSLDVPTLQHAPSAVGALDSPHPFSPAPGGLSPMIGGGSPYIARLPAFPVPTVGLAGGRGASGGAAARVFSFEMEPFSPLAQRRPLHTALPPPQSAPAQPTAQEAQPEGPAGSANSPPSSSVASALEKLARDPIDREEVVRWQRMLSHMVRHCGDSEVMGALMARFGGVVSTPRAGLPNSDALSATAPAAGAGPLSPLLTGEAVWRVAAAVAGDAGLCSLARMAETCVFAALATPPHELLYVSDDRASLLRFISSWHAHVLFAVFAPVPCMRAALGELGYAYNVAGAAAATAAAAALTPTFVAAAASAIAGAAAASPATGAGSSSLRLGDVQA